MRRLKFRATGNRFTNYQSCMLLISDLNENAKAPTCYRGDQSMVALSSALVLKMVTLFPTLLKVIAAKAIFGILMGVVSVILSKMAILPLVLSYANKNINQPHSNVAPITGSYRQGMYLRTVIM